MIAFDNTETSGWEAAFRGMRNPMNSWANSDSYFCDTRDCERCETDYRECSKYTCGAHIGADDLKLAKKLRSAGPDHRKYLRMIVVTVDITAPLYWWKEFDTYKVGTVSNSCSTMHRIMDKKFTIEDFSSEHLIDASRYFLDVSIDYLNYCRSRYFENTEADEKKRWWWQIIQLLPTSYNQRRTIQLSYENLVSIYNARRNHKLDEWRRLCEWIETLPYAEDLIIGKEKTDG